MWGYHAQNHLGGSVVTARNVHCLAILVILFFAHISSRAMAQEELPGIFQLNFYTEEFTDGGPLPDYRKTHSFLEYDCTNAVATLTNVVSYETGWTAVYHQLWDSNVITWPADTNADEGFLDGTSVETIWYVDYTNGCVVFPAHADSSTNTITVGPGISRQTSSGKKGTINGRKYNTKINFLTRGQPGSSNSYVYQITVAAYDTNNTRIDGPNITVLGKTLDTNWTAYVVLSDNTTNDATPAITGTSDYYYQVGVSKVKIDLTFRNSGSLTPRETNGAGYQADLWDSVVAAVGTDNLGSMLPQNTMTSGTPAQVILRLAGQEEMDATVPIGGVFTNGWAWHRDVQVELYSTTNGINYLQYADFSKSFTQNALNQGGNDNGGIARDITPDINGLIISSDSPSIGMSATDTSPIGIVYKLRFYAHEWLTWNGGIISDVKKWHSFVSIRKYTDGGWEYYGTNEIDLTPDTDPETPSPIP